MPARQARSAWLARIAAIGSVLVVWTIAIHATGQDALARVTFGKRPVPGAVVTAIRNDRQLSTTTDVDGLVRLAGLDAGTWTLVVEMTGFDVLRREIHVPPEGTLPTLELTLRPLDAGPVRAAPPAQTTRPKVAEPVPPPADETGASSSDGFLVNGSVNNAAASPFAQPRGFGNNRPQAGALYTGNVGMAGGTSRWDARPYSFTGTRSAVPSHTDLLLSGSFGGPLKPWPRDRTAPRFFVGYQGSSRQSATTESLRVPTARERTGDFSRTLDAHGAPVGVTDPATGLPFDNSAIPSERISRQALSLLELYPLPNRDAGERSNFDAAIVSAVRQDDLQSRVTHVVGRNILLGTFALQRAATRTRTAFGFDDLTRTSGIDALASWNRRFAPRLATRFRYQHTRLSTVVTPFFADRINVSGDAGITGNDQSPDNWGPPRLTFSDMATLGDIASTTTRTRAHVINVETYVTRQRHAIIVGGDLRLQNRDVIGQQDARGTFTFTGAQTGVPFADFLLGLPAASAIGVGNAEKTFTSRSFAAYVSDDARLRPTITLTMGVRWEYDAPVTESLDRLANLDVAPGFVKAGPVTAADRTGPVTGRRYSSGLVSSDFTGIQPRVAVAWRPIAGSSLAIRAGFGIYRNGGLHQSLASALSEQPPFSRTARLERSEASPITLAHGFASQADATGTFAVDPDVRAGYARTWQVSAQRDLPASLSVNVSYLGSQGRRLVRQILPNTTPPGGASACPTCPQGFVYLQSNGRASRHALQVLLRRRLRDGLSATAQYTLARAFDDASSFSGGVPSVHDVAQDWENPGAEWSPSSFDQRHLLVVQFQYTTGVGLRGGALLDGWVGAIAKGWTISGDLSTGSGLPLTPVYVAVIPGSGFVGLRPDLTGAPINGSEPGRYASPDAFAAPAAGRWGNAGRHSIRGPAQFRFDLSAARSFELDDRRSLEWRVDATNVLNHVTFAGVHTTVGSPLVGLPGAANAMRKIQTSVRLRF